MKPINPLPRSERLFNWLTSINLYLVDEAEKLPFHILRFVAVVAAALATVPLLVLTAPLVIVSVLLGIWEWTAKRQP